MIATPASPNDPVDLLVRLTERLHSKGSLEIEYKRGKGGLPRDLWSTVSAFANTNGGWIVVGVREDDGVPTTEGLRDPDPLLQDFYNLLRNPQKISFPVCGADDATTLKLDDGTELLVIRVPAASRKDRPIYVGGNPYVGTFLRRNSGDYHCQKREVDRMMRDASDVAADSEVLKAYTVDDLDLDAVARYRQRHQTANPGSPWNGYDLVRFLGAIHAYGRDRQHGHEGVTVAGLLLFGTREALRSWRTRHLIDYRELPEDGSSQERWTDRIPWEGHLFGAFETLYPRLVRDLPRPFTVQGGMRLEDSPAHVAMREALVNLLVHADYAESLPSLVFRHEQGCRFQNPGSSRISEHDLFSGDRSDPRNPNLVAAFRYVGLADEAGTGIPKIFQAWRALGLHAPNVDVGTERYEFQLRLRYVHLLSDTARQWLASLGGTFSESEQIAMIHAKEDGWVDNPTLSRLTGDHSSDCTKTLTGLRDRGHLSPVNSGRWTHYVLSPSALSLLEASEIGGSQPDLFDGAGLGDSGRGLGGNSAGLGDSGPGLGDKGAGLGDSGSTTVLPVPDRFREDVEMWAALETVASPVRNSLRVSPGEMQRVVVALCSRAALSREELQVLLNRSAEHVADVLRLLRRTRHIGFSDPERASSPRQRYVSPPVEP